MIQYIKLNSVMEAGDHMLQSIVEVRLLSVVEVKNGASPKSLMSRGNYAKIK